MAHEPPRSAKELLERYASGERDFRGANFSGANLIDAILIGADLSGADFTGANFGGAILIGADLSYANLRDAILIGADLVNANLSRANLVNANLSRANLIDANLSSADLANVNLIDANLGRTVLARVSLMEFCKADPPVVHYGPSSIDFESITMSLLAPNLENFLVRAGIPQIAAHDIIDAAKKAKGHMQSVFISYGTPNLKFATRLNNALLANNVRTWFFPNDAEPGKPLHRTMRDGVNKHDRVILICSKPSLTRNGVLVEIEESLRRESKQAGEMILIPITLDNFLYGKEWQPPDPGTRDALLARVVADFRGLDKDPAKFDVELSKLLRALRVKNTAPTTP